jgi:hypothetical protein
LRERRRGRHIRAEVVARAHYRGAGGLTAMYGVVEMMYAVALHCDGEARR